MTHRIGILQGRLSRSMNGRLQIFPVQTWEQEFAWATEIGFTAFELLVTAEDVASNPLLSHEGRNRLKALARRDRLPISSICADVFKTQPFFRGQPNARTQRLHLLHDLIQAAQSVGAKRIGIPILEDAALQSAADRSAFLACLREALPEAEAAEVEFALEMDQPAWQVLDVIRQADHPLVKAYYDVGNAAALGFDIPADIRLLGPLIGGVHIKDRPLGGPNVELGSGAVDFPACFAALQDIGYPGPLILETPPGNDPIQAASRYLSFVREHLTCLKS